MARGERRAARLLIPAAHVWGSAHAAAALGFAAIPSAFLVRPIRVDPGLPYSDGVEVIADDASQLGAAAFLYLARDEATASRAWATEALQDDAGLGLLFGYPSCCIAAYLRAGAARPDVSGPVIWRTSMLTNRYSRLFGFELVSHEPCAADCAATVAQARRHLRTLGAISPSVTAELVKVLSAPVLVLGAGEFLLLDGATAQGEEVSAMSCDSLAFGVAARLLRQRLVRAAQGFTASPTSDGLLISAGSRRWALPGVRLVLHSPDERQLVQVMARRC